MHIFTLTPCLWIADYAWNHRIIGLEENFKDHLFLTSWLWAGTSSTRLGGLKPHVNLNTSRDGAMGWGILSFLGQPVPLPHHPWYNTYMPSLTNNISCLQTTHLLIVTTFLVSTKYHWWLFFYFNPFSWKSVVLHVNSHLLHIKSIITDKREYITLVPIAIFPSFRWFFSCVVIFLKVNPVLQCFTVPPHFLFASLMNMGSFWSSRS